MIVTTSKTIDENFGIEQELRKCYQFIKENDLSELQCGKYIIEGENLYVNIVNYQTKKAEECIWESHKKYLDVHYMISGCEKILLADVERMQVGQYFEDTDYVQMTGKEKGYTILEKEDLLVLFPKDAHMTGCFVNESQCIKKAIFKVKIER